MILEKLTVAGNDMVNVPAEEKTLLDLGVAQADVAGLIAQAKQAQLEAQCQHARSFAYQSQSDGLAFDYLAAQAEFGEQSTQAETAKAAWLGARKSIKAHYPKP
ncbi:hypothetical protein [Pseudoalteromonas sp. MMG005]|uniref:hypothetical protein n=1 Tax=Pseudoalteromonas sp. MMG005 TaxID=2822682 RepID=UPI001B3A2AD5|nr:hypothetical protein [Pseudoalteromonas sp. MMG005]MBQ4844915.1 hypothetical protein [Pseudoalteromonas sp. MMG005]